MSEYPHALKVDAGIAAKCIGELGPLAEHVGQEKFDAVLRELQLDEFLEYDEWGQLTVNLTDIQVIAVVYALGAFIKGGAEWDGTRAWAGRFLAPAAVDEELPF